jgi:hypothetical protein
MSNRIHAHLRSNVVGYVAVFLALTGTAYATHPGGADTISTGDIIDGQVRTGDVGNDQIRAVDVRDDTLAGGGLTAPDLAPGSVASSELATNAIPSDGTGDDGSTKLATDSVNWLELAFGSVRTQTVLDNSLTGGDLSDNSVTGADVTSLTGTDITDGTIGVVDLSTSATGARAWGRVSAAGVLTRSKNVTSVTHPDVGQYCIDPASSIPASTAVLIVSPDRNGSSQDQVARRFPLIAWESSGAVCPPDTLKVLTNLYDGDETDDDDGGGNTTGDSISPDDEPFAFTIP